MKNYTYGAVNLILPDSEHTEKEREEEEMRASLRSIRDFVEEG